jgi:hypothetical protein
MMRTLKVSSYGELLYSHGKGQVMMNMKDWLVLPQRGKPKRLSEEQSYPKLLELMRDLDKERGHLLTNKQVNALQAVIQSLIDAGACVTYHEE